MGNEKGFKRTLRDLSVRRKIEGHILDLSVWGRMKNPNLNSDCSAGTPAIGTPAIGTPAIGTPPGDPPRYLEKSPPNYDEGAGDSD